MAAALFFTRSLAFRLKLCRYPAGEATTRRGLSRLEGPRRSMPVDGGKVVNSDDAGLMQNLNDSQSAEEEEYECPRLLSMDYHKCHKTDRQFVRFETWGYSADGLSRMNNFLKHQLKIARSPRPYLAQMIVYGAIPDLATFSILIQSYCEHLKYNHIVDVVFTQMKALKVEADESFHITLMDGVCGGFGPLVGFQLLKKLRSRNGIRIPLSCYNVIVGQFRTRERNRKLSMVWLLIDVLADMRKHEIFPEDEIYNCLVKARRHVFFNVRLIKAIDTGRRMFAEGIKVGAVSPNVPQRRRALRLFEKTRAKLSCKNRLRI